jgi:predicted ester cyclase
MGIPPTGNCVSFGVFDLVHIADGMIVEHWGQMDNVALM